LNDDLLRLGSFRVVAEKNLAVNAVVRAFLLLDGSRADEAECPPLELVFVFVGERGGFNRRGRFAMMRTRETLGAGPPRAQPTTPSSSALLRRKVRERSFRRTRLVGSARALNLRRGGALPSQISSGCRRCLAGRS